MALDLGDTTTGPKQLKLFQYPLTQFGTQKDPSKKTGSKALNGLNILPQIKKKCCFVLHFSSLWYDVLLNDGVSNWQKALSKFQKHEATQSQKDSVVCW